MDPIDTLMDEHRHIEAVLRGLSAWARALGKGTSDGREDLARFVRFIQGFADHIHHGKEEDILFSVMTENGFPRHQGPIAVMLAEHAELRGFTAKMQSLSEQSAPWSEADRRAASQSALAYVELLEPHIEKEDQILYTMAEAQLPPEAMALIARRFEAFEADAENARSKESMAALGRELARG